MPYIGLTLVRQDTTRHTSAVAAGTLGSGNTPDPRVSPSPAYTPFSCSQHESIDLAPEDDGRSDGTGGESTEAADEHTEAASHTEGPDGPEAEAETPVDTTPNVTPVVLIHNDKTDTQRDQDEQCVQSVVESDVGDGAKTERRLKPPSMPTFTAEKRTLLREATSKVEWLQIYFDLNPMCLPGATTSRTLRTSRDCWVPVQNARSVLKSSEWLTTVSRGKIQLDLTNLTDCSLAMPAKFGSSLVSEKELSDIFGFRSTKWSQSRSRWDYKVSPIVDAWFDDPNCKLAGNSHLKTAFRALNKLAPKELSNFIAPE